ncbi:hypothetical protein GR28A_00158 [Vibrio phage vB_VcorM_GR28A]|nr:hypothetical protein GR28A_00158 [Vibrio phage vB_VcorM_GR28A]
MNSDMLTKAHTGMSHAELLKQAESMRETIGMVKAEIEEKNVLATIDSMSAHPDVSWPDNGYPFPPISESGQRMDGLMIHAGRQCGKSMLGNKWQLEHELRRREAAAVTWHAERMWGYRLSHTRALDLTVNTGNYWQTRSEYVGYCAINENAAGYITDATIERINKRLGIDNEVSD